MALNSVAKKRLLFSLIIILFSVGCDQATKTIAQDNLELHGPYDSYLNDVVRIQYVLNTGAAFSIGANLSEEVRFWIFIVGQGVFLLFLAIYLFRSYQDHMTQFYGFCLILGGGLGNFYDRIFRDGAVVDFLNLGLGETVRTAIFNVADISITTGLFMLIYGIFKGEQEIKRAEREQNESNGSSDDSAAFASGDSDESENETRQPDNPEKL